MGVLQPGKAIGTPPSSPVIIGDLAEGMHTAISPLKHPTVHTLPDGMVPWLVWRSATLTPSVILSASVFSRHPVTTNRTAAVSIKTVTVGKGYSTAARAASVTISATRAVVGGGFERYGDITPTVVITGLSALRATADPVAPKAAITTSSRVALPAAPRNVTVTISAVTSVRVTAAPIAPVAALSATAQQSLILPAKVQKASPNQANTASGVFVTVTGWDVSAGFQAITTPEGILCTGSGVINISAQINRSTTGTAMEMAIVRGSTVIGIFSVSASTSTISGTLNNVLVSGGDVISIQRKTGNTVTGTVVAGANTFIHLTQATGDISKLSMGMDKVGTQLIPTSAAHDFNTATTLTGWELRPGFPNTSIADDSKLVNQSSPMTVNYNLKMTWQSSFGSSQAWWLVKNDSEIVANGSANASVTGAVSFTSPSDYLTVRVSTLLASGYATVQATGTNTYLSWTVAP